MNGNAVVAHPKRFIPTWKSFESINCLINANNRSPSWAKKKNLIYRREMRSATNDTFTIDDISVFRICK